MRAARLSSPRPILAVAGMTNRQADSFSIAPATMSLYRRSRSETCEPIP